MHATDEPSPSRATSWLAAAHPARRLMPRVLQAGERVRLKRGGPLMKVVYTARGVVACTWFDGKKGHCQDIFLPEQLERVSDGEAISEPPVEDGEGE